MQARRLRGDTGASGLTRAPVVRGERLKGDSGVTTEFVIITPVLLMMIMMVVQFALVFHANNVASAAAQEGVRTATMEGGPDIAAGEAEAHALLDALASSLLPNPQVQGQLTDGEELVRITVTGEVIDVYAVPGLDLGINITQTSEGVVERFRPADEAPPSDTG